MLRLCAETNAENLSGLHNPLYALPAYPLYRLGKKLPRAVSCIFFGLPQFPL